MARDAFGRQLGKLPEMGANERNGDRILILPDDDGDGVADRAVTFAYAHNPIGFEFWNGGVIVVTRPELLFFKDTDGDDVADERIVLMQGIGSGGYASRGQ